ncbi:MAG: hypothetical protein P4M12_08995 [Gammaproteobacteria bacterium]|nr:hypothetical protein [Gammaproteobacteria bacterium]
MTTQQESNGNNHLNYAIAFLVFSALAYKKIRVVRFAAHAFGHSLSKFRALFFKTREELDLEQAALWKIEAGPRVKSLATEHLEYITYALMNKNSGINFFQKNDQTKIEIQGKIFNLTALLKSKPDFEQLIFTKWQLDAYQKESGIYTQVDDEYRHLHSVEIYAIKVWTGNMYSVMNKLLRNFTISPRLLEYEGLLLIICIAAQALSKPPLSSSLCRSVSYRREEAGRYFEERRQRCQSNQLVTNRGFTAASTNGSTVFNYRRHLTYFSQPNSLNPIGKYINEISCSRGENELLFPPNTEFIYKEENDYTWSAQPVRSANPIDEGIYHHGFSESELTEIKLHKEKIKLKSLLNYINIKIKEFNPGYKIGMFDSPGLKYLTSIVSEINNQLSEPSLLPTGINKIISKIKQEINKSNSTNEILNDVLNAVEDIKEKIISAHGIQENSISNNRNKRRKNKRVR